METFRTVTLYRIVGTEELLRIAEHGWIAYSPPDDGEAVFRHTADLDTARLMVLERSWNPAGGGPSYLTRCQLLESYLDQRRLRARGEIQMLECLICGEELEELNRSLVGPIVVVCECRGETRDGADLPAALSTRM